MNTRADAINTEHISSSVASQYWDNCPIVGEDDMGEMAGTKKITTKHAKYCVNNFLLFDSSVCLTSHGLLGLAFYSVSMNEVWCMGLTGTRLPGIESRNSYSKYEIIIFHDIVHPLY